MKWKLVILLTRIFAVLMFTFCIRTTIAQGAWDLNYLPIDSVKSAFLGSEIRIDFKSSVGMKKKETNIRKLLSKRDTVTLEFDTTEICFTENWKLYTDHGVLSEQTLQGRTKDGKKEVIVREVFITALNETSLTLEMYLYYSDLPENLVNKQTVIVKKSLVRGILIRL